MRIARIRLPAMCRVPKVGRVIRIGGGKWKFYWWYEPECPAGSPRFRDDLRARMWLQQFQADGFSAAAFRSVLAKDRSPGLQCISDEKVLELVAHKLVSGEIRIARSQPEASPARLGGTERSSEEQAPPFPLGERRAASRSISAASTSPEEAVFAFNADLIAIAAVLKEAARLGTPF